jgi:hypothetical protein
MANELRGPLPIKVDATSNGEFRPVWPECTSEVFN